MDRQPIGIEAIYTVARLVRERQVEAYKIGSLCTVDVAVIRIDCAHGCTNEKLKSRETNVISRATKRHRHVPRIRHTDEGRTEEGK